LKAFFIYRISDKRIIKRFDDPYEADFFLRDQSYCKEADFTGFLFPQKFLMELKAASVNDILTVRRGWHEYVVKHGPEIYPLPEPNKGFLKKILDLSTEAINHLVGRSLNFAGKRRCL